MLSSAIELGLISNLRQMLEPRTVDVADTAARLAIPPHSLRAGDIVRQLDTYTVYVVILSSGTDGERGWSALGSFTLAPINTDLPAISGTANTGETLTTTDGTWTQTPTSFTYQWQKYEPDDFLDIEGVITFDESEFLDIDGETANTYVVGGDQNQNLIRCKVTATNASGSTVAHSLPVHIQNP